MAAKKASAMSGFMDFVREQGVVGLAVGFILGGAVSNFVSALVEDIINPILGAALGSVDLSARSITLVEPSAENAEGVVLLWGDLLSVGIDLLVIAAVVYFGVKKLGLDKLDKEAK